LKTKYKIFVAKIILKILNIFITNPKFVHEVNGIKWNFDLNEGIDLNLYIFKKFEYEIINSSKKLNFKKNSSIIDIGANSGIQTLQFANTFKKSKIYAIEPTDFAFNKLKKNIILNQKLSSRIKIFQAFITNKKIKPSKVYSSWNLKSKNVHKNHYGSHKSTKFAKVFSLDKFIIDKKIKNISLIKIDVDGNELFVFKSAINTLRKYKIPIIMELAPYLYKENNYSLDDLIKTLKSYNYSFFDINNLMKINDIYYFASNIPYGSSKNILIK
tara:strand:- start:325 stop:1137 length:813 start_codon:yes stop_codon:yes gene_type:complete